MDHPNARTPRGAAGCARRLGRTGRVTAAVVAVMALAALSCQSSGTTTGEATPVTVERVNLGVVTSDEEPVTGGKIVYGLNAETNGWNPGSNQWAAAGLQVMRTIFDTLTAFDDEGGLHPYLARSFEHNADFTVWTIELRPDVVLHNGDPVTAETIVRNQNYMKASPVTNQAYQFVESFVAESPTRVVATMTEPWAQFPYILATQIGVVADPTWLESNDGLRPVGTGPFVFDEWEIGDHLTVVRNADYWQQDLEGRSYPYLDEVEFRIITDDAARSNALQAGDLDIMETASPDTIVEYQDDYLRDDYQLISDSGGEMAEIFIQLNNAVAPFDNPDARRALAYATNKQAIIDEVQQGLFEPANGPYAPSSPWFAASSYPQYDPVEARRLVDQVKAANGGSFTFTIEAANEATAQRTLQLLQQQWSDVGIDVTLKSTEQASLIIEVVTGGYQAVQWQQFDSAHPVNDMVWWTPENAIAPPAFSLNFARYRNDAVGTAMDGFRKTDDVEAQRVAVTQIQTLMGQDVPYVWLFHAQFAIIATPKVVNITDYRLPDGATGLGLHMGAHPLHQVWLDT